MALLPCRECQHQVSTTARACPHWQGTGYEWKSQMTVYGYPLVYVALGRAARGKLRAAKGVIAIGQLAIGYYALGQIAYATYAWSLNQRDPAALEFFARWLPLLRPR